MSGVKLVQLLSAFFLHFAGDRALFLLPGPWGKARGEASLPAGISRSTVYNGFLAGTSDSGSIYFAERP